MKLQGGGGEEPDYQLLDSDVTLYNRDGQSDELYRQCVLEILSLD